MSVVLLSLCLLLWRAGVDITTKKVRNLIAGRLGGTNAEGRMKALVAEFLKIGGNKCAFIQDENELTCAVILQSRAQAAAMERWPSTIVMDWTYNMNNLGFHLGEWTHGRW